MFDGKGCGMTILCEKCFSATGELEIYAYVPMSPCVECGKYDDRYRGGAVLHDYPRDPRVISDFDKAREA